MPYAIGLDYGTNSVRCLIVDTANGKELGTAVWGYQTGQAGIILDKSDHNVARQNPADYLKGLEITIKQALTQAKKADKKFSPDKSWASAGHHRLDPHPGRCQRHPAGHAAQI
jgi:L-ribulokinase